MALPLIDGRVRSGGSTWQSLRRGTGSVESAFINGESSRWVSATVC
jgi:2-dehydropantoate 2-reductase